MILKTRTESDELKLLKQLDTRMDLSNQLKQYYSNLEKGYEGELKFDRWLENVQNEHFIINDLLLNFSNTVFQIDSLLITNERIYLFEVKNYEGDYYIENDLWYSIKGNEIKDPLLQLKRSESLLRTFIQTLNLNFSIEAYLVFINPEFTLYQTPLNFPAIFHSQLNRFIQHINTNSIKLQNKHTVLANYLISHHLIDSPFTRLPDFQYEQLQKGITCASCGLFMKVMSVKNVRCNNCCSIEKVDSAVMRNVEQFVLLFPTEKITTNIIHDWCKIIESKKTIRRILTKHLKFVGFGRHTYFEYPIHNK